MFQFDVRLSAACRFSPRGISFLFPSSQESYVMDSDSASVLPCALPSLPLPSGVSRIFCLSASFVTVEKCEMDMRTERKKQTSTSEREKQNVVASTKKSISKWMTFFAKLNWLDREISYRKWNGGKRNFLEGWKYRNLGYLWNKGSGKRCIQ